MIAEFIDTLNFSLSVTGPIFLILGLGVWLRRIGMLTDAFIEVGSRRVFNVTLPALLFISVSKTRLDTSANFPLIGFGLAATLLVWGPANWWRASRCVSRATGAWWCRASSAPTWPSSASPTASMPMGRRVWPPLRSTSAWPPSCST
jgi:hypothetical protein